MAWTPPVFKAGLSRRADAVRLGAITADIAISASARNANATWGAYYGLDTAAIQRGRWNADLMSAYSHDVAASLDVQGSREQSSAFKRLELLGRDRATVGREMDATWISALATEPDFVMVGAWLEAGRVAARRGDRDYFLCAESQRFLSLFLEHPGFSSTERASVRRLRTGGVSAESLTQLEMDLTALLKTLTI